MWNSLDARARCAKCQSLFIIQLFIALYHLIIHPYDIHPSNLSIRFSNMSASNRETLTRFYTAFANLDHETMKGCYHESATFRDEVFTLNGRDEIAGMWRMLCETTKEKGADVWKLEFSTGEGGGGVCTAHWEADYRYKYRRKIFYASKLYWLY